MAKMLALCCFECFFSLNFILLFLCQCVKKPSFDGFFIFIDKFYRHLTVCIGSGFALSSVEQPQPPPQPTAIFGFNHRAARCQPNFSQRFDKADNTAFADCGNSFLNTTAALHNTNAITIKDSNIRLSNDFPFKGMSCGYSSASSAFLTPNVRSNLVSEERHQIRQAK
jgi:hypothetical protein